MNQLDFSPISQKDQQSIDTYSFIHNPFHNNKSKPFIVVNQACNKIFDNLSRVVHNRKCYSFQLLKQFILFSSDEQTISIHYKYMQYQIDEGTEHLENTYGLRRKLTLGKAFEDIRNFSKKKKIYENPVHIQQLVSVYDKILNLNTQESYRCVIKILASFIQKQVVTSKGSIKIGKQEPTVQLINNLQKQINNQQNCKYYQLQHPQEINKFKKGVTSQLRQSNQKRMRRNDLLKTAKFSKKFDEKEHSRNSSNWKQQVQNVDSYEEEVSQQNHRQFCKSKSSQFYNTQNLQLKFVIDGSNHISKNRENKCVSISRQNNDQDVFQTRRKKTAHSNTLYQDQVSPNIIQNVIVIRGSKSHKRQPDRFIRVPVVSDQIKIIQFIPENKSKKQRKAHNLERQSKQKYERKDVKYQSNQNKYKYVRSSWSQKFTQQDNFSLSFNKVNTNGKDNKINESHSNHECLGCKYCHVIKQMETYRLQRNSKVKSFVLM